MLLRTLYHLLHEDLGFSTERVLTLQTAISANSYKGRDLASALFGPELDRIRQLPGVKAAGFVSYLPLSNGYAGASFNIPGRFAPLNAVPVSRRLRSISWRKACAMGASPNRTPVSAAAAITATQTSTRN